MLITQARHRFVDAIGIEWAANMGVDLLFQLIKLLGCALKIMAVAADMWAGMSEGQRAAGLAKLTAVILMQDTAIGALRCGFTVIRFIL